MERERKRYWVLRLGLIALTLLPLALGLALGDPVPGGPGSQL